MLGYLKSKAKGLIQQGTEVIMALVLVGIIAGAGVIALGSLYTYTQTGTPSALLNATVGGSINNSMLGVVNLTQQLGTVGTEF